MSSHQSNHYLTKLNTPVTQLVYNWTVPKRIRAQVFREVSSRAFLITYKHQRCWPTSTTLAYIRNADPCFNYEESQNQAVFPKGLLNVHNLGEGIVIFGFKNVRTIEKLHQILGCINSDQDGKHHLQNDR